MSKNPRDYPNLEKGHNGNHGSYSHRVDMPLTFPWLATHRVFPCLCKTINKAGRKAERTARELWGRLLICPLSPLLGSTLMNFAR